MPFKDQQLNVYQAHVISRADMDRLAQGRRDAVRFVEEFGKSNRDFLKSLIVPAVDDPFEGRSLNISRGSYRRESESNYHPRRGHGAEFDKYESILNKCGLGTNLPIGQSQHTFVPTGSEHPLQRHFKTPIECEHKFGIQAETGSMRTIPQTIHEREVPDWTLNDDSVCKYLIHRCAAAFPTPNGCKRTDSDRRRARRKVAELCAVIYLWFRLMLPAEVIADDLGITATRVIMMAQDARDHYPKFMAGTCKCSHRGRANQFGKCKKQLAA